MLNMSDQFYNYLSSKLFDYFKSNPLVNGDRFYIQFDEDSQIVDFYNSIKEYGENNSSLRDFTFKHEKGDEFTTFSIDCDGVNLVIAESTNISEDYLVTLRNQVSAQKGAWQNTALLIIYNEAKDSIFNGMGNLASEGMPLNINYISNNLEEEISNSKNLGKEGRQIIRFSLNNLKEDIFQTTLWDYETILSILKSEKINPNDLYELKLFPDKNLGEYNAHKMQSRLKENFALFDEIESCRRYGEKVKECLKKKYDDDGFKIFNGDDWYLTDYNVVKNLIKEPPALPLTYEENHEKLTNEGLKYWEKPLSSKPAGMRKRQIIIFNDKKVDTVSFELFFDQNTKKEFLSRDAKRFVTTPGKKLKVEFDVFPDKPTFKQISYKHNNQNNSHYIFNLLVLNASCDVFDSIKSRYILDYKKKLLTIINDEDSEEVIFGVGENQIEKEIDDDNKRVILYDEDSILISEKSPAFEEGFLRFDLVYHDNDIPINIAEESKKPVPVKSSVIWNLKRQNRENFTFNGSKATQGVNSVYLEDKFKEYLDFERQIINDNIFYGIKEIDGTIKKQNVEYSDELTEAYNAIFEYYKTFDDTPEDNLPSLVYLNDELKSLYENFLEIFNREISEINENDILADFKHKKDLIKLGRIDDDKRIMYSSLSPINIAYQLEIANQCADDELANNLAERLVPNNLIPYIFSDSNELYRPIFQENVHEWLIYERSEDVSIGTTNAFISNVVSEKLNQFVKHFDYLFDVNNNSPLKINLINIVDDIEVVKGVFGFIRDRLPDKLKTKNVIPVEINIYNDADRSSFETLFNCNSKEDVNNIFGIKIKSDLLDEIDVLHSVQNNIKYYHKSMKDDFEYAHISFYKITSDIQPVSDNMDKMETGLSLHGLISSVASTTKHSDYRTGFGIKNVLDKENTLVKSAMHINELIENSKNHGKNSYSKGRAIFTSITLDDENIDKLYRNSHWITFIEPTFGIEYFDTSNDVIIIHYSDQYTSSNKYDTITVTYDSLQYKQAIKRFLEEKRIELKDNELNGIIRMFNSINGEWLLKIVSSSGEFDREKLSLISAAKYGLALLDNKDIIWIPISLEEILRIAKNLKLDKAKGLISAFVKQGSYSDDLLFIGLNITDEDNLEIIYYPIEVKIGLNDSGVIKKGKSQIDSTHKLLHELLNGNSSKFINKFFRNFFIQLFLSNQQKLLVNEIWDEKDLGRIEKYKAKLLNDEYQITRDLENYLGKGSLFSFKNECHFPSIKKIENKLLVEIPEEFAYETLSKSVHELYSEIQSGETEFPRDKLVYRVDLNEIEHVPYEIVDDDFDDNIDNGSDGIVDDSDDDFDEPDNPTSENDDKTARESIDTSIASQVAYVLASSYHENVINELHKNMGMPKVIAENCGIRTNHISKVLKELSDIDLVVCINPESRKGRIYKLTELGNDVWNELAKLNGSNASSGVIETEDNTKPIKETEEPIIESDTVSEEVESETSKQITQSFELEKVGGLIGTAEGSTHEIYWEFGAPEINNRHMLIEGASGYGKSYFIQRMLKELSNQGIPSIIVDYTNGFKKSKLEPEFKESVEDRIEQHKVMFEKFPLNPFKKYLIEDDDEFVPELDYNVAGRFKNIINNVYNFGDQQQMAIYNAALSGISKYGDEMDLTKFKEELIKQDSPQANSTLNKLTQFLDINPFKTDDFDWSCLDEMDGKIRIIQLAGLSRDIQIVITEFILLDLWNYKFNLGKEERPFIVVLDEAQNLDFSNGSSSYNILKEGRKFGWSGWFATQSVKGSMKSDEITTLENANEKIYFHPIDNSISDIAVKLSKDGNDKKYWEQKLSKLNKGQCIVHGHLKDHDGNIYSAKPVCVDISEIGFDSVKPMPESQKADINRNDENDFLDEETNQDLTDAESNSNTIEVEENEDVPEIIESDDDVTDYEDTRFITKKGNKYEIYKTINGRKKYYGSFDTLKEAQKRRDELIVDNWGYSFEEFPPQGRTPKYGKYITFHNGRFKVLKLLNGQQRFIGAFNTVDEAKKLRDFLIDNNWDLTKVPQEYIADHRSHKIRKIKDRYIVQNIVNGEREYYESFDSYEEAEEYLNWLIENDWQVDDDSVEEKIDEYVYGVNGEFIVRNEIDGEMKIFGRFEDMGEAIQYRNKCVRENWKL